MPTLPINVHGPVRSAGGRRACLFAGVLLLCLASPVAAQLAIGGLAGAAIPANNTHGLGTDASCPYSTSAACANFGETDNTNPSFSYGGEVAYRYKGLMAGLLAQEVKVPYTNSAGPIGVLRMRVTLFTLGYQSRPSRGRGMAFHFAGGYGFARTSFQEGSQVAQLSQAYRSKIVVATKDPPAGMFGVGFDYFISSHASITFFEMRGFWSTAAATWTAVDRHPNVTFVDVSPFRASSLQALAGVRFWIH